MNPENREFRPNLPEWFEKTQGDNYRQVLVEELAKIDSDPVEYFKGQYFYMGEGEKAEKVDFQAWMNRNKVDEEEVKNMLRISSDFVLKDLELEKSPDEIESLKKEAGGFSEGAGNDFVGLETTLMRRLQAHVLRRMVSEYLPRRNVILHRGKFDEPKPGTEKLMKLAEKVGLDTPLMFALKDPRFKVEKTRENLEKGIGGFECDIKMRTDGEPVVVHSYNKKDIENAPTLEEYLKMVKELVPEDVQAPRQARRGLEIFLHTKITAEEKYREKDFVGQVLKLLDQYNFGSKVNLQFVRADAAYEFDEREKELTQSGEIKGNGPRYVFQYIPLGEMYPKLKVLAGPLKKMGARSPFYDKDDEPRTITKNFIDEPMVGLESLPHGKKMMQVLHEHKGSIMVTPAGFRPEMLEQAEKEGVSITLGSIRKEEVLERTMGKDEKGRRPRKALGLQPEVVYPEKGREE
ncbi:MAG: hypothetical protein WC528_04910 [Patescibacteria group bacterium]